MVPQSLMDYRGQGLLKKELKLQRKTIAIYEDRLTKVCDARFLTPVSFHNLTPVSFHNQALTSTCHCLSSTCHCLSSTFHCLSSTFHRISSTCHCLKRFRFHCLTASTYYDREEREGGREREAEGGRQAEAEAERGERPIESTCQGEALLLGCLPLCFNRLNHRRF